MCRSAVHLALGVVIGSVTLLTAPNPAGAQVLIASDDSFSIPFGGPLIVEAYGVLDNDTLDGEPAGENGATATVVTGVAHGTLSLLPDGSFTYTPDGTFDGIDGFVYQADYASASSQATVSLTACGGGPEVFDCWKEAAFLAKAAELGFDSFQESFEDDAIWGLARSPYTAPSVVSQGIRWESNHPDPPASNEITTGSGAARNGQWGIFDPDHGYATGTPTECDVDTPPSHCLFHDGFTGVRDAAVGPLHGVGGYLTGTYGANVGILIDGAAPIGGGKMFGSYHFFGVIDTSPTGFSQFEYRELDGKVGQALFIFADDFTLLIPQQTAVVEGGAEDFRASFTQPVPNPSDGHLTFGFSLPSGASARLTVYDLLGRLVRDLGEAARGEGPHAVTWNGCDDAGVPVPSGIYFGRLSVTRDGREEDLVRRIVVMR
jgi:hypothetical protein